MGSRNLGQGTLTSILNSWLLHRLNHTSAAMDNPSSNTAAWTDLSQTMPASPEPETLTPEPIARLTTPVPPALPPRSDKRALLLVYIHGFKGNETSFKEFPTVNISRAET